jgi:hypothetical protein
MLRVWRSDLRDADRQRCRSIRRAGPGQRPRERFNQRARTKTNPGSAVSSRSRVESGAGGRGGFRPSPCRSTRSGRRPSGTSPAASCRGASARPTPHRAAGGSYPSARCPSPGGSGFRATPRASAAIGA